MKITCYLYLCLTAPLVSGLKLNKHVSQKYYALKPETDKQPCMLVPAYRPHFQNVNARLLMTNRTNIGPQVKTIVVFTDAKEHDAFCKEYSQACREDVGFRGTSLEELLGATKLQQLTNTLGMHGKPKEVFQGDRQGCFSKSAGRVLQTVKKFYGAAYASPECSIFWVSDAESLPYRKHNLYKHLLANEGKSNLMADWHNEKGCAHVQHDDGSDPSCAAFFSSLANGFRHHNDVSSSQWTKDRYTQEYWWVDQWWTYEPRATTSWLDLIKETSGREAWDFISFYEVSDNSLYHPMMDWLATQEGSTATSRNIRDALQNKHATAFNECCSCDAATNHPPPCSDMVSLLGDSCLQQKIPMEQMLQLMNKDFGVFGVANYNRFMYVPVDALNYMDAEGAGFHWCYNNCFKPEAFERMQKIENVDMDGLKMFEEVFYTTPVFF